MSQGEALMRVVVSTTLRMKFNDALRCFEAAADLYRQLGKWRLAGAAFSQCADCEQKMREPLCAASYFVDAAEAMQKVDPGEAVRLFGRAIAEYAVLGRFHVSAALQRTVAELYEDEEAMHDAAVAHGYAADYYLGEAMAGQAIACLLRSGQLLAMEERYEMAAETFQRAVTLCLDDNLLKFNSPSIALDIVLCFLCLRDDERSLDFIESHTDMDFNFAVSRERRFALDIILNCQERDRHSLLDHAWNFDYVCELKPYRLGMLREILDAVQEPVADSGSDSEDSKDSWLSDEDVENAKAGTAAGSTDGSRSSGGSSRRSREGSRASLGSASMG